MGRTNNQKTHIIVHHTAVSYDKNPDQFKATNSYHKTTFKDIPSALGYYAGYTYEIAKNGTVYKARYEDEQTVAVKEQLMNFKGISICLDGEFDTKELPTDEQCKALLNLIRSVQERWNIPDSRVLPHRYFAVTNGKPYKQCWGKRLPDDIISYLKTRVEPEQPSPVFTEEKRQEILARARKNRLARMLARLKKIFNK